MYNTINSSFIPISNTQMGYTKNLHFCLDIQDSTAFFIFLLISSSSYARFTPQEGSNSKLIGNDTQVIENEDNGKMGIRNMMIGSKPPICEWKKYCGNCGKCKAIQVPVVGQSRSTNTTTRSEDISNYKPMCWKCKCGDFVFNP